MSTIELPSSLQAFREQYPDLSAEEARLAHDEELTNYRKHMSAMVGMSVEDFHEKGLSVAGRILMEAGVEVA